MADLSQLLAGHGLSLRSCEPGRQEKVICPKCHDKDRSFSIKIDDDGRGFTGRCHRSSCGHTLGAKVASDASPRPSRPAVRALPAPSEKRLTGRLFQWFEARGITRATVEAFGCYETDHTFPGIGREPAIVLPYTWRGELVNRKYRRFADKHPMAQDRDATPSLFNADCLLTAPETIVFVEGELDCMAIHTTGYEWSAVSLKDGAGNGDGASDKRYAGLETHAAELAKVKRIILAGDSDMPGAAHQQELARRFGRHRCALVRWPDGCKDANDTLLRCGPSEVVRCLDAAESFPIEGLKRVERGSLRAIKASPPPTTMSTGCKATDATVRLPTEGRLISVSGWPSHGKTNWLRFVMIHTAHTHKRRWAVFSPEMQPWEHYVAECAEVFSGKSFYAPAEFGGMNEADVDAAESFLADHVEMLVCDAEDVAPTLDWILELARAAVLRDGCTDLVIDPWNEVEHQRGELTETEYIGRSLQRLKAFGLRHGCNVWIVVHPAKPLALQNGQKRPAAGPYDCAGSAHWANKSDLGITVHSPKDGVAEVHLWKSRFKRFGKRGDVATLDFDRSVGRYSDPLTAVHAPGEVS